MKIAPKYKIGDLLMCKSYINPYDDEDREDNIRPIIGWIVEVRPYIYYQNKLITYLVQWSDQDKEMLISEEDAVKLRDYYEEIRSK